MQPPPHIDSIPGSELLSHFPVDVIATQSEGPLKCIANLFVVTFVPEGPEGAEVTHIMGVGHDLGGAGEGSENSTRFPRAKILTVDEKHEAKPISTAESIDQTAIKRGLGFSAKDTVSAHTLPMYDIRPDWKGRTEGDSQDAMAVDYPVVAVITPKTKKHLMNDDESSAQFTSAVEARDELDKRIAIIESRGSDSIMGIITDKHFLFASLIQAKLSQL